MPTTLAPVDFTHEIWFVQNRTNAAAAAVDDAGGEALRKLTGVFATGGAVTPNAFKSTLNAGTMNLTIGGGIAKKDLCVVPGTSSGAPQPYIVSLDQTTVTVTLPASSASNLRRDELYLVVPDQQYPTSTVSLPRLIVRQGDLGGALPGPDAAWRNYQVIGQYYVGQNATAPIIEQQPGNAKLQSQIMATHASGHVPGGADPLGAAQPWVGKLLVPIADWAPGTTVNAYVASTGVTLTLPAAYGSQNIRVFATARATYNQAGGVSQTNGQQVRLRCVIQGDTTGKGQETSTNIPGGTGVSWAAGHDLDLNATSTFSVQIQGWHGVSNGGTFVNAEVDVTVMFPRPDTTLQLTYA